MGEMEIPDKQMIFSDEKGPYWNASARIFYGDSGTRIRIQSENASGDDVVIDPDADCFIFGGCIIQGSLSKGSGSCLTTDIFYNSSNIEIIRGMVCISTGETLGDRTFSKPISSVEPCSIPNDKRVAGVKVVESYSHTIMGKKEFDEKSKVNFHIGLDKAKPMENYLENLTNVEFADLKKFELNDGQYDLMKKISKTKKGKRLHIGILGQYSKVLVDADINPVENGDMLTTSSTIGHGMKSVDMVPGTMFGKALQDKQSGKGYIRTLLFSMWGLKMSENNCPVCDRASELIFRVEESDEKLGEVKEEFEVKDKKTNKRVDKVHDRIDKVDGRINKLVISSFLILLTAVVSLIFSKLS